MAKMFDINTPAKRAEVSLVIYGKVAVKQTAIPHFMKRAKKISITK